MTDMLLYIEPQSLVMTGVGCFYCKVVNDTVCAIQIYWLFGLKCCAEHKISGKRDCRAWMHKNGYVKLRDAFKNETLADFLNRLDSREFKVTRSSGEIQDGWHLNKGDDIDTIFIQRINDNWMIPCRYPDGNDYIRKHVIIADFSDIIPGDLIEECTRILTNGIYFSEFEEQCALDKSVVPETAGVVRFVNGDDVVRILIPSLVPTGET